MVSSKYEKRFGIKATSAAQGVKIMIQNFPIKMYVQKIILKNFILVIKEVNNLS